MKKVRFVGLDVHADTIAVAIAEPGGEVRSLGTIPNRPESVQKLVKKLGAPDQLHACYEAGPTGYVLYWQLAQLGVKCDVVAPTLVPVKAGDRVKTDRRDAEKLARCLRGGDLTPVWVPDAAHEALRDLVRAREAAKKDEHRARQRLAKFLLRHGHRAAPGMRTSSANYLDWVRTKAVFEHPAQHATLADYIHQVEHQVARLGRLDAVLDEAVKSSPPRMRAVIEALQALKGVATVTAVTIVAELGEVSRFSKAKQLMGYSGLVSSEHSSGQSTRRGGITKTGNAHLRRILVEAAWNYRYRPAVGKKLRARQQGASEAIKEISWKAQHRLHSRYRRLGEKGKPQGKVVTAVARELLGFVWAVGVKAEQEFREAK